MFEETKQSKGNFLENNGFRKKLFEKLNPDEELKSKTTLFAGLEATQSCIIYKFKGLLQYRVSLQVLSAHSRSTNKLVLLGTLNTACYPHL